MYFGTVGFTNGLTCFVLFSLVFFDLVGFLWFAVFFLCFAMVVYGFLWFPMVFISFRWLPLVSYVSYGVLRFPMVFDSFL